LVEKPQGVISLGDLSVHGSITLKYILRDGDCDWIGLAQGEVQLSAFMNGDEPSDPIETGHFFIC
jgi:hypothetical protein